jgi:hypothetical protein
MVDDRRAPALTERCAPGEPIRFDVTGSLARPGATTGTFREKTAATRSIRTRLQGGDEPRKEHTKQNAGEHG